MPKNRRRGAPRLLTPGSRGPQAAQGQQLYFEPLEARTLLSADPLSGVFAEPARFLSSDGSGSALNASPTGLTVAEVQKAYGIGSISFSTASGGIQGTGAGQTIAIVDAYDDPNIAQDLKTFDQQFGLPDPVLTKVQQSLGGHAPIADATWDTEISLDVEWAHAVAPGAKILLVEANSSSLSNLLTSVQYAAAQPGVSVVSMSWGVGEFAGETSYDSYFTTPAGHAPVSFVAATGDSGAAGFWPAASPSVLAVGGTTLSLTAAGAYAGETVWAGSGGGQSLYESESTAQAGVETSGRRDTPDVAYDANPSSGFAVYDSMPSGGKAGWITVGGTSAGAPQWAGLIAIADQGRALLGQSAISNAPAAIYALPASDFHDITAGKSGHAATAGYDLATGRGTPIANVLVGDLVGHTPVTVQAVPHPAVSVSVARFLASSAGPQFLVSDASAASTAPDVQSVGMTVSTNGPSGAPGLNTTVSWVGGQPIAPPVAGGSTGDAAARLRVASAQMSTAVSAGLSDVTGADQPDKTSPLRSAVPSFSRGPVTLGAAMAPNQQPRPGVGGNGPESQAVADVCFAEENWIAEDATSSVEFSDDSPSGDVALLAWAVALAACMQAVKPATLQGDLSGGGQRHTVAIGRPSFGL